MSTGPIDLAAYVESQQALRLASASVARYGPDGARERAEAAVLRQIDFYVDSANAWRIARPAPGARLPLKQTRRRA